MQSFAGSICFRARAYSPENFPARSPGLLPVISGSGWDIPVPRVRLSDAVSVSVPSAPLVTTPSTYSSDLVIVASAFRSLALSASVTE